LDAKCCGTTVTAASKDLAAIQGAFDSMTGLNTLNKIAETGRRVIQEAFGDNESRSDVVANC
jgi:hypothetical protein